MREYNVSIKITENQKDFTKIFKALAEDFLSWAETIDNFDKGSEYER